MDRVKGDFTRPPESLGEEAGSRKTVNGFRHDLLRLGSTARSAPLLQREDPVQAGYNEDGVVPRGQGVRLGRGRQLLCQV